VKSALAVPAVGRHQFIMAKQPTKKARGSDRPMLLVAAPDGRVFEHDRLEMTIENGLDQLRVSKNDVIPIPAGWDLMAMPGTRPVGYDPATGTFETVTTFTDDDGKSFAPWAVAVHPPPGYVRAFHPGAEYTDATHPDDKLRKLDEQREEKRAAAASKSRKGLALFEGGDDSARPGLPLWAYTAVGMTSKGPVAALFLADETTRWAPELYYQPDLKEKIAARLALDPTNQVLNQLAECAGEYLCCCAQNVFYERWEGAVPIAPACTAACLGCLSKEPAWQTPAPQRRLRFSPTSDEIGRMIAHHLERAPEPMMSFGQGCEGEPTMNHDVIVGAIARARAQTQRGIININTNGSRPETVRACAKAGANALRVSLNTFDRDLYEAYYRPADFTFDDVIKSMYVGRDEGMHVSINLLIWPGWSDRMEEIDRISKIVEDGALHMIQLRNLCVDPGHFRTLLPPREKRGMLLGMKEFVAELNRRHPKLRFGTFNPRLAAAWYEDVPAFAGRL
jgi:pyruvate-formate lyase-activating enzyme